MSENKLILGDFHCNTHNLDEAEVVRLYVVEDLNLRETAKRLNTNHKLITRILIRHNIEIIRKYRLRVVSNESKAKMSASKKGKPIPHLTGIKHSKIHLYKNMMNHMKYDVSLEFLMRYEDIEKLKFLNKSLRRTGVDFSGLCYSNFVEKFYHDSQFNTIYHKWLVSGKYKWLRPSIDHIVPISKGGDCSLSNLRFLTWLENKCKSNIGLNEWENIKANINEYFI